MGNYVLFLKKKILSSVESHEMSFLERLAGKKERGEKGRKVRDNRSSNAPFQRRRKRQTRVTRGGKYHLSAIDKLDTSFFHILTYVRPCACVSSWTFSPQTNQTQTFCLSQKVFLEKCFPLDFSAFARMPANDPFFFHLLLSHKMARLDFSSFLAWSKV